MNLPLTLPEAQKLCSEFQYLVGTSFDTNQAIIKSVIITPYDAGHKQRFFAFYLLYDNDATTALSEYTGNLFDVTVIAEASDGFMINESLQVWASKNSIFVNASHSLVNHPVGNQVYL